MIRERVVASATNSGLERLHRAIKEGFMPEPHASRITNHEMKHWVRLRNTRAIANFGVLEKEVVVNTRKGPAKLNVNVGAFVRVENMGEIMEEDPETVAESAEAVGVEMSEADKNVSRVARRMIFIKKEREKWESIKRSDIYISEN